VEKVSSKWLDHAICRVSMLSLTACLLCARHTDLHLEKATSLCFAARDYQLRRVCLAHKGRSWCPATRCEFDYCFLSHISLQGNLVYVGHSALVLRCWQHNVLRGRPKCCCPFVRLSRHLLVLFMGIRVLSTTILSMDIPEHYAAYIAM
jgi:hypothetical protein